MRETDRPEFNPLHRSFYLQSVICPSPFGTEWEFEMECVGFRCAYGELLHLIIYLCPPRTGERKHEGSNDAISVA